ncbi:DNA (Cytosine-5-)-methyltransferase [Neorhizobium galegae bv. officinalis bv. officinalis str. HAMBI 1141]|uniref:DNA (Cytosine-5-)-methyltransferase n=1 Tax=Neorhizobium galegae bv. officinalis bv. officinalis str. HAMBI 1141 TaxID=1028801 RepID=A0A068TAA2_NEOGA|nr:endonuclease domain-containing protein [Neorhizobium galegae]CDN54981.1 DNA (Cytosine-5-)-methyltransferase [Neorhizobium galegae bv. officinalis bv. officinalis str. HAMBI 1141]
MPHFHVRDANRKNARNMRRALTEAELKFWNAVRAHRLMGIGFRRQMPIAGYIVDFACPEHKLIIEIDGVSHSYDQNIRRDLTRDQQLASLGWQVVRFTNDEVHGHIDDVCMHLLRIIGIDRFE